MNETQTPQAQSPNNINNSLERFDAVLIPEALRPLQEGLNSENSVLLQELREEYRLLYETHYGKRYGELRNSGIDLESLRKEAEQAGRKNASALAIDEAVRSFLPDGLNSKPKDDFSDAERKQYAEVKEALWRVITASPEDWNGSNGGVGIEHILYDVANPMVTSRFGRIRNLASAASGELWNQSGRIGRRVADRVGNSFSTAANKASENLRQRREHTTKEEERRLEASEEALEASLPTELKDAWGNKNKASVNLQRLQFWKKRDRAGARSQYDDARDEYANQVGHYLDNLRSDLERQGKTPQEIADELNKLVKRLTEGDIRREKNLLVEEGGRFAEIAAWYGRGTKQKIVAGIGLAAVGGVVTVATGGLAGIGVAGAAIGVASGLISRAARTYAIGMSRLYSPKPKLEEFGGVLEKKDNQINTKRATEYVAYQADALVNEADDTRVRAVRNAMVALALGGSAGFIAEHGDTIKETASNVWNGAKNVLGKVAQIDMPNLPKMPDWVVPDWGGGTPNVDTQPGDNRGSEESGADPDTNSKPKVEKPGAPNPNTSLTNLESLAEKNPAAEKLLELYDGKEVKVPVKRGAGLYSIAEDLNLNRAQRAELEKILLTHKGETYQFRLPNGQMETRLYKNDNVLHFTPKEALRIAMAGKK